MKKNILIISILLPLLAGAQNKEFALNGNVAHIPDNTKIYLFYNNSDTSLAIVKDSAYVANGKFRFKGQLTEPRQATLRIEADQKITDITQLYIEPGTLYMQGQDSLSKSLVVHSKLNNDFYARKKMTDKYITALTQIRISAYKLSKEAAKGEEGNALNQQYKLFADTLKQQNISFIKFHPDSYISLETLKLITGPAVNVHELKPLFESLSEPVKTTPSGIRYAQLLKKASVTDIGSLAPNFVSATPDGKKVSLKDFIGKSKLLLLDFWASWCGPCRAENPNVVKAYNQFHAKGFDIISVSLDQNAASWKAAIAKDGMPWEHVSSLKGWQEPIALQYNVQAVPTNFLIDPTGKIIAKNLRGDDLEKELEKVFR